MDNQDATGMRADVLAGAQQLRWDIERWAQLVADGEVPWPSDAPPATARRLVERVDELRRQRLMRLIARAIAKDVFSEKSRRTEC